MFPFNKYIGISNLILNEDRFLFLRGFGTIADQNVSFENMNGKWIRIPHLLDTLKWNNIVYDKKDQSQWISFPYELVHYDKDFHKIRSYTQNDGYAGPAFHMLFDNAGYIWFDGNLDKIYRLDTASGIITTLTEADGGTDVHIVHEGVPNKVPVADNETGMRMALANLAQLVEAN